MILLIDNYDSFSYNVFQLVGSLGKEVIVKRNDAISLEEIEKMAPSHIIISPGPGRPKDAGICEDLIAYFKGKIPILGICLGHQAICEVYGAQISYAKEIMHGKQSEIEVDCESILFRNTEKKMKVARYHSLAALSIEFPKELNIIAQTKDGEIMAVESKRDKVYGLQFHPESILTKEGKKIVENFLNQEAEND